jgi:hypothetical protein
MAEQPVNLSTVLYLGVFSRAEQRVLQAVLKAIAEGNGKCVATAGIVAEKSAIRPSISARLLSRNFGHQDCDHRRDGLRSRAVTI